MKKILIECLKARNALHKAATETPLSMKRCCVPVQKATSPHSRN